MRDDRQEGLSPSPTLLYSRQQIGPALMSLGLADPLITAIRVSSTVCQAAVHTRYICMAFGSNVGLGHNIDPGCHRTMDLDMVPATAWAQISLWPQVAAETTHINILPIPHNSTALIYTLSCGSADYGHSFSL